MEATLPKKVGSQTRLDTIGAIAHRWRQIRPDLDPSPLLVIGRISRIESLADARLRPPFDAAGLAPGDFDLLAALRRQGPPHESTPSELATNMLVTTGAATKRIDRLEAQGLCTRRTSPLDGRGRVIALTRRGKSLVDKLMTVHLKNEADILANLSPNQRTQLARLLALLISALE